MSLFGLLLIAGGVGFLCWLLFTLAIFALPIFVALSVGGAAFQHGAGYSGAFPVALISGAMTFAAGKSIYSRARSPLARLVVGLVYVVPAAIAGFEATLGLASIGTPSEVWCDLFAGIGAIAVALVAWSRLDQSGAGASDHAQRAAVRFRAQAGAR